MTDTDLHETPRETTTMPLPPAEPGGTNGDGGNGGKRHGDGRGNAGRWIGTAVVAMVLGFAGGIAGYAVADHQDNSDSSSSNGKATIAIGDGAITSTKGKKTEIVNAAGALTPAQIYKDASPAVVHIKAEVSVQSDSIFGVPTTQQGEATGSGFVIDKDGHIVTNAHVVNDATSLSVSFDNKKEYGATLVGKDESTDIAILKVDADGASFARGLTPLEFGDSGKVQVGDPVVAIGNPYDLDRTLTTGVISALQRQLQAPNGFSIDNVLQTDAAINPGNSGGPLFNLDGRVIGVNSQIQSKSGGNDGIGFAVPSVTVQRIAQDILQDGVVKHAWLGVSGEEITSDISKVFRLPQDKGVLVETVGDKSPAAEAGIKGGDQDVAMGGNTIKIGGDVITKLDGKDVTKMQEIADIVNAAKPGDEIKVTYYRGDKKHETTVKLGTRPNTVQAG